MDWSPESCVLWRPFYSTCQKIPVYKCSTTMAVSTWCDFLPLVLWLISDNRVTFYLLFTHSFLHPLSPNNSVLSSCFNRNDLLTFIFSFPPSLPPTSFLPLRASFLLPPKSSSSSHLPCSPFLSHSPLSYFLLFPPPSPRSASSAEDPESALLQPQEPSLGGRMGRLILLVPLFPWSPFGGCLRGTHSRECSFHLGSHRT